MITLFSAAASVGSMGASVVKGKSEAAIIRLMLLAIIHCMCFICSYYDDKSLICDNSVTYQNL